MTECAFQINSANNKLILYSNGTDMKSATQVGTNAWSLDTVAPGAGNAQFGNGVISDTNQMTIGYDHASPNAAYFSRATLSAPAVAPTVTAPTATGVTASAATLGGNVTADGGSAITARGVVYAVNSTNANPTLDGTGVTNLAASGTTGAFTTNAAGLASGTTYAYRAYATNSAGTTPTNAASVSWTVTFANPLSGLTAGNFTLANAGLTGTPAITAVAANGGTPQAAWTVTASTGSGSGTLGLNFTDGSTTTPTVAGTLVGEAYAIDHVPPTVQSINTVGAGPTKAASVSWNVTFSEPVSGVAAANFSLAATGLTGTPAVTGAAASGSAPTATWTVMAGTGGDSGTIRLDMANSTGVADAAGNAVSGLPFAAGQAYTIDRTPPAGVAGGAERAPDSNGWYNRAVKITFTGTDPSGIASCTVTTYSGPDSASASVPGTCTDQAGNVGNGTFALKYDATKPTVTYTGNAGAYTADQTVSIPCTPADATSGVASSTCANISGPAYTFKVGANPYSATATDVAGNQGTGSTSFTVTVNATSINTVIAKLVTDPSVAAALQQQANAIASAPNAGAKANKLNAFINAVNAQTGKSITAANATILINLAKGL